MVILTIDYSIFQQCERERVLIEFHKKSYFDLPTAFMYSSKLSELSKAHVPVANSAILNKY